MKNKLREIKKAFDMARRALMALTGSKVPDTDNPETAVQTIMQTRAAIRRLAMHERACLTAYDAKAKKVLAMKGKHKFIHPNTPKESLIN